MQWNNAGILSQGTVPGTEVGALRAGTSLQAAARLQCLPSCLFLAYHLPISVTLVSSRVLSAIRSVKHPTPRHLKGKLKFSSNTNGDRQIQFNIGASCVSSSVLPVCPHLIRGSLQQTRAPRCPGVKAQIHVNAENVITHTHTDTVTDRSQLWDTSGILYHITLCLCVRHILGPCSDHNPPRPTALTIPG